MRVRVRVKVRVRVDGVMKGERDIDAGNDC